MLLLETEAADTRGTGSLARDSGVVIETNIDDMNPQYYAPLMNRLLANGALDVWVVPILMKKGRPATTLGCLCRPGTERALAETLLRETTTLGVRMYAVDRLKADAEIVERETSTVVTSPFDAVMQDDGTLFLIRKEAGK